MSKIKDIEEVYSEQVIERGEGYLGNVRSCTKMGNFLHAKVQGSSLYKTKVDLLTLEGECSCPYEYNCKHAVAAYLYYKKGKGNDAEDFLSRIRSLSKEELIQIIEKIIPEKPELIRKYTFRTKKDFSRDVNEFINDFSIDKLEDVKENLDCLNFEQLLKILDYIINNEDKLNDAIAEDYGSFNNDYYEEDGPLSDFQYDVKGEIIKNIKSKDEFLKILKKGYMNNEIADNAEQFFSFKDSVKQYLSKEQYLMFLINCKNPDLKEIKGCITKENWRIVLGWLSIKNIELAEKLAEYIDNDELRFIVGYHKKDPERVIKYFSCFDKMKEYYLANPESIVSILQKKKNMPKSIAVKLFKKNYLSHYSVKNIRFLVANIEDKDIIAENIDFKVEFSKIKEVIVRLEELNYDIKKILMNKQLLAGKHWTEVVEIIRYAKQKFGNEFARKMIIHSREEFMTSSTLKHNLKKEGIVVQNIRGEMKVGVWG